MAQVWEVIQGLADARKDRPIKTLRRRTCAAVIRMMKANARLSRD